MSHLKFFKHYRVGDLLRISRGSQGQILSNLGLTKDRGGGISKYWVCKSEMCFGSNTVKSCPISKFFFLLRACQICQILDRHSFEYWALLPLEQHFPAA